MSDVLYEAGVPYMHQAPRSEFVEFRYTETFGFGVAEERSIWCRTWTEALILINHWNRDPESSYRYYLKP